MNRIFCIKLLHVSLQDFTIRLYFQYHSGMQRVRFLFCKKPWLAPVSACGINFCCGIRQQASHQQVKLLFFVFLKGVI